MPTVKKTANEKGYKGAIFSKDVKNYANDPFFVKKNEEAKIALSKINFPEHMKK